MTYNLLLSYLFLELHLLIKTVTLLNFKIMFSRYRIFRYLICIFDPSPDFLVQKWTFFAQSAIPHFLLSLNVKLFKVDLLLDHGKEEFNVCELWNVEFSYMYIYLYPFIVFSSFKLFLF